MYTPHTYDDSKLVSGYGPFPAEHHYPRTNAADRDATARRLIARGAESVRFVTDRVTYDARTQTRTRETVQTISYDTPGEAHVMTTTTTTRTPETDAAELHRLADIARDCGIWLYRAPSGAYYCTSATDPTAQHHVTAVSCDCPHFARSHRCIHTAHLLDCLGWLPPLPATEPATEPRPIRRRLAPIVDSAAVLVAMIAGLSTEADAMPRPRPAGGYPGGVMEYGRLSVDEGPTWRVIYIGRGDPRRVILADGRTGVLNCRAHTFTITGGPSYFVDC